MFVRFLCCMLRPSPSYSFLSYHASYWKVKPIILGREKRHFTLQLILENKEKSKFVQTD